MIKASILSIVFFILIGCTSIPPVTPRFPTQDSKDLLTKCPDLKQIEGNQVAITDLLKSIVHNYTLYYECSLKNENWIRWYKEQKQLYDSILNK